jgi:hypothetical protein
MMPRRQDMRLQFFKRLHKLQDQCCSGKIAPGAPKHLELLALEALESLYVQREMKRVGQVELSLAERTRQKMDFVSC